ncbi:sterol desaturase family protein [Novosphingobium sp. B 225]|uniref:sterol desaturase family protein n=1 Tax=Novosphingobium sp. B 225 TaxID=1961849 RepID=UPI000B4B62B9|nr:sterol desaturase family protein [Novosphingobium sp. B 225]
MPMSTWAVLGVYLTFALIELLRTRLFAKPGQTRDDAVVEVASTVILLALTQPAIVLATDWLLDHWLPQYRGALTDLNIVAAVLLFLVFDDMAQYWWHRASHSTAWLYNLHRAHHNAGYMSVRLVYRNNLLYYAMMPAIWFSGVLVYLGLGWVYAGYVVVKQTVIIAAHSDAAWDRPLYRIKALSPLMWLVERTISTPATHHAHHGQHATDPGTHYKGNYGNLLFFWDVLFGSARITRRYPESYGVENLPHAGFGQQLLWPLVPENKGEPVTAPRD